MQMLNCYVFSVLNYICECWTWNKSMRLKVNAFERWCYRMILGISWKDRVSTKKLMVRAQTELQTELHFTKDMIKRKMKYAGYMLRGSSGLSHLQILEGMVEGKKKVGCLIKIWMKDIRGWTSLGTYEKVCVCVCVCVSVCVCVCVHEPDVGTIPRDLYPYNI